MRAIRRDMFASGKSRGTQPLTIETPQPSKRHSGPVLSSPLFCHPHLVLSSPRRRGSSLLLGDLHVLCSLFKRSLPQRKGHPKFLRHHNFMSPCDEFALDPRLRGDDKGVRGVDKGVRGVDKRVRGDDKRVRWDDNGRSDVRLFCA